MFEPQMLTAYRRYRAITRPIYSISRSLLPHCLRSILACIAISSLVQTTFAAAVPPLVNRAAVLDFDGDRKTDFAIERFELIDGDYYIGWHALGGLGSVPVILGRPGWPVAPADYDGDGKWDVAVYLPSLPEGSPAHFYIIRSSDRTLQIIQWGTTYDDPGVTQDFDGDGKADPTVTHGVQVDPDNCYLEWFSLLTTTGQMRSTRFGLCTDRAIRGDFDGDGKADIVVYRRNANNNQTTFYVLRSSDGQLSSTLMDSSGSNFPVDFDGDGKTDYCVINVVHGRQMWNWIESSTGRVRQRSFGTNTNQTSDAPVPGDYDGDGKTDLAEWRRTETYFYVEGSRQGLMTALWGTGIHENALSYIVLSR